MNDRQFGSLMCGLFLAPHMPSWGAITIASLWLTSCAYFAFKERRSS